MKRKLKEMFFAKYVCSQCGNYFDKSNRQTEIRGAAWYVMAAGACVGIAGYFTYMPLAYAGAFVFLTGLIALPFSRKLIRRCPYCGSENIARVEK